MKKICCILLFGLFLSPKAFCGENTNDLSLSQYRQIEVALTQGDESLLPKCLPNTCPRDMRHLLSALSYRIQWKLKNSLKEANDCELLSRTAHVATHYLCSRLMTFNAQGLDGLYGLQQTIPILADAVDKACNAQLWGNKGSCADSPIAVQAHKLKTLTLAKEVVSYSESKGPVTVLGDGSPQTFVDTENGKTRIDLRVSYPTVHASINGKDVLLTIDTGAQGTTLYRSSAKRVGLVELSGTETSVRDIAGATSVDHVGIAKTFVFANVQIKNKSIQISDNSISLPIDGVIGLDILDKLHAFELTKTAFTISPELPSSCSGRFTVSTDAYSLIFGLVAQGTTFNDIPVVAILDTGNAAAPVTPTWHLISRFKIATFNAHRNIVGALANASLVPSADVRGSVRYLGKYSNSTMSIGANASSIDLNIGAPFFYGDDLYIDFDSNKICLVRH